MLNVIRALLAAGAVLVLAACGGAPAAPPTPAAATGHKFDVNAFVGTYKGTWTNNNTGASGPATIEITADQAKRSASITINMDGSYLGLADPPPQTLTVNYDDTMAKLQGNNPLFGDYIITIDADGNIIGAFKNLAAGAIPEMNYTGTVGNGKLDADYVVKLADGKVVNSILRTTKQ